MKQTSLKSIARHLAAVNAGKVEKTNIIDIRKAINAIERGREPDEMVDAVYRLECAIEKRRPRVVGELHESGLKVLRNRRYAKRWDGDEQDVIDNLHHFELIRFDRVGGPHLWHGMPVYRAVAYVGFGKVERSFAFRNIPWQTAFYSGLEDGPRVMPERESVG